MCGLCSCQDSSKGYTSQSYEEWQDASLSKCDEEDSVEDMVINNEKLAYLADALATLTDLENEIAINILTGNMTTAEFARFKDMKRTTVSDKKKVVLEKLQKYFRKKGYEI